MKIFAALLTSLILAWTVNYYGDIDVFNISARKTPPMTALVKAGNECVAISEQATAHLVPKLEFQRMELAGRKANVVVLCMADRHFHQNPAWLKYSLPIAAKIASEQHISVDEALENLKRADMLVFTPISDKPIYWQQAGKTN